MQGEKGMKITVNWVRFAKVFAVLIAVGLGIWASVRLATDSNPNLGEPALATPGPVQGTRSAEPTPETNQADALVVYVGSVDHRDITYVSNYAALHSIRTYVFVHSGADDQTKGPRPIGDMVGDHYDPVTDRASFARVMHLAERAATEYKPMHVLFLGAPRDFNELSSNSQQPTIASLKTMESLASSRQTIALFYGAKARHRGIMQHLLKALKDNNPNTTVVVLP